MKKNLQGSAAFTHGLNEFGGNKGMKEGLRKLTNNAYSAGYRDGLKKGSLLNIIGNLFDKEKQKYLPL